MRFRLLQWIGHLLPRRRRRPPVPKPRRKIRLDLEYLETRFLPTITLSGPGLPSTITEGVPVYSGNNQNAPLASFT